MEAIDRSAALEVIERGEVAHIGVSDADGPYVSPISYVIVDDHLCFITSRGRRLRAMKADPRVCIEISEVDDSGWRSAIIEDEAEIVTGMALHTDALQELIRKYQTEEDTLLGTSRTPGPDLTEMIAVPLKWVTGRSSGEGTNRRTRPGRM